MTMADTIAVMNKGRIEQLGAPVDLYENPQSAFVAGFLGQSNLISATVLRRDGDLLVLDFEGVHLTMPAARAKALTGRIEVGVRPEKIAIGEPQSIAPGANVIHGTIVDTSFVGVSTQYLVRTRGDEEVTVFSQNTASGLRRVGDAVTLSWRPEHTFGLQQGAYDEAVAAEVAS